MKSLHQICESAVMAGTTILLCTSPLLWMDLERTSSLQRLQLGHGRSFRSTTVGNADVRHFFVSFCFECVELVSAEPSEQSHRRAIAEPSPGATEPCPRRLGRGCRGGAPPYCSMLLLSYFVIFTSYLHKLHQLHQVSFVPVIYIDM